ncbi:MAG: HlyC/CorC family transporter [Acidimicrobiia bacterium]|nr:HlyC/CorC family transporter [Acidimicrobiia bacterium]
MLWRFLLSVLMLVANGFFTAAEFSIVTVRRTRMEQLARDGNKRARVAVRATTELSLMLAGAQFGITLTALVLGWIAEPLATEVFEFLLGTFVPEGTVWVTGVSVVLGLFVVVFFHMTFAEMVPKNIAIAQPVKTTLLVAVPFVGFVNLFRWLLQALNSAANAGLRLLGVEPSDELVAASSPSDLVTMLGESRRGGAIGDVEHKLLSGALEFGTRTAAEVMVPRTSVVALPADASVGEAQQVVRHHGHSRIPVFEGNLDHVLGFVHAKDLVRLKGISPVSPIPTGLIRDAWVIPESRKLFPLLFDMRAQRNHFGLVVDEHGGTAGIVTLEDILEELVGEIDDEYDLRRRRVRRSGVRTWICDASLRPDEIEDPIGLVLPEGEYDTLGGFILDRLGAIPEEGTTVEFEGWTFEVLSMDGRRVGEVQIAAPAETPDGS